MSFENFKPTLWSNRFIVNTDKLMVFKNVADTSWTVDGAKALKINEIGDVTVTTYGSTGVAFQALTDAQKEMPIDQKKYFAFKIEDVDAAQMNVNVMNGAMQKAAYAIADEVDQRVAAMYSEAGITNATNLGSAATGLNLYATDMPDLLTYMMRYLKEANAHGRPWCVAPPWFMQLIGYGLVANGTGAGVNFDSPGAVNTWTAPQAFPFMGFDFYESNNVPTDSTASEVAIMFGTQDALGFASQLEKIEALRPEGYFADAVKGLYIYGTKVIRPDHLGVVYANFTGTTT